MKTFITQSITALLIVLVYALGLPQALMTAHAVETQQLQAPARVGELWKRTELFFGTSKPDGTAVAEDEINAFVDAEITPRFPDGLTALSGYGQFRNSAGVIVQEQSIMLILLYPPSMREAHQRIEEIRDAYKAAFQQESVLRVDSTARVSF